MLAYLKTMVGIGELHKTIRIDFANCHYVAKDPLFDIGVTHEYKIILNRSMDGCA